MRLVATINGVPVYSNKSVVSVVNGLVTFADGSWCNANTGEVRNLGDGYISVGGTGSSRDSVKTATKGPERVVAAALEINSVPGDVRVDVHDSDYTEYVIAGPEDAVEGVRASMVGNTLSIQGDGRMPRRQSGVVVTGSVHSSVQIGFRRSLLDMLLGRRPAVGAVTISSGGANPHNLTVTVRVPRGTSVGIGNAYDDVVVGDTDGPLRVDTKRSSVRAGRVTDVELIAGGSGDIRVAEVTGTVIALAHGGGDITIKRGTMPTLVATAQGNGDITIGGTATTATLRAAGNGDIDVVHVVQPPHKHVRGNGDIRVRRVG